MHVLLRFIEIGQTQIFFNCLIEIGQTQIFSNCLMEIGQTQIFPQMSHRNWLNAGIWRLANFDETIDIFCVWPISMKQFTKYRHLANFDETVGKNLRLANFDETD